MEMVNVILGQGAEGIREPAAERRRRINRFFSSVFAMFAMIVTVVPVALSGAVRDQEAKPLGEVLPDKALIYLIRPGGDVTRLYTTFVYSDQVLLGTVDSSSYGFAYADAGEHLVWSVREGWLVACERFEFVSGQTYYLKVDPRTITMISKEEGIVGIDTVRSHKTTTDEEIETSRRHIEKKWAKVQKRDSAEPRAAIEKVVVEPAPVDVSGKVRIPKGTTVKLELLENVSTWLNQPGDTVRFRVVDDLVIDGNTFLHAGTNVDAKLDKVKSGTASGKPGVIDIVIPGVRAADGSLVPLVGRVMGAGADRLGAGGQSAALSSLTGGFGGGVATEGGAVLIQLGKIYEPVTPVDVWVDPRRVTPPVLAPASIETPGLTLASSAREVKCRIGTACAGLGDIVITLQSEQPPSTVSIRAIDGRVLPSPISASVRERAKGGGWMYTFPGWSVVRNLPLKVGTASAALRLEGSLDNGTAFKSDTAMAVVVRE